MKAGVCFLENVFEISNFTCSEKDASIGNPYNCSFDLKIISGSFSGISPCEYDIKEMRRFLIEIEEMYQLKRNVAELKDIGYGTQITFKLDKLGHINISGIIYGTAREHSMTFSFDADQSSLGSFCKELKLLLN